MEHSTTLFERNSLSLGRFIILETSTGNEETGKLHGIVIAAKFEPDYELKTIFQPMKYSLDLKPEDFEILDSSEVILERKMEGFQQWTNYYIHQTMSYVYRTCLQKIDLEIKHSKDIADEEYHEKMEKAFGKDESNWDSIELNKETYSKYKEFFKKIESAFVKDYPELKSQLDNLKK